MISHEALATRSPPIHPLVWRVSGGRRPSVIASSNGLSAIWKSMYLSLDVPDNLLSRLSFQSENSEAFTMSGLKTNTVITLQWSNDKQVAMSSVYFVASNNLFSASLKLMTFQIALRYCWRVSDHNLTTHAKETYIGLDVEILCKRQRSGRLDFAPVQTHLEVKRL